MTADGQPAAYVSVVIKNSTLGTVTNENGNFEIRKIKPGQYILQISLLGYSDQEIEVTVKENEVVNLKIPNDYEIQLKSKITFFYFPSFH